MSELKLTSDLAQTRKIRAWLDDLVPSSHDVGSVELALVELCNNIVEHGYQRRSGEIVLNGAVTADLLEVTVVDNGSEFTLDKDASLPDDATVRGYGLHIIRKLTKSLEHQRVEQTNHWILEFELATSSTERNSSALSPTGRLDAMAAQPFRQELLSAIDESESGVVVDLERLDFCDSSGLAALVVGMKHAKAEGKTLKLIRPTKSEVWSVFELTQFDQVFTFEEAT